ncbi:MAG TPA: hypothetical protein VMW35_03775 [Myxococcota bacterium]|nr:hypothetical protein [Myxococcota bacterium]
MRLVLSRKGFDAASGGAPSPILADATLCPLPIPDPASPCTYRALRGPAGASGLAARVERATRGRIRRGDGAHLDPDLDRGSLVRRPRGWRPVFGQCGAAQAHLARQGVGPGDLFLFFGWFRREGQGGPGEHTIFGWLQIGERVELGAQGAGAPPFARRHPHCFGRRRGANVLYVARERLAVPGLPPLPGAGRFARFAPELRLSADPLRLPKGVWRLPAAFAPDPARGAPGLSHHADGRRWRREADGRVLLRSVGRGQEFVLDLSRAPELDGLRAWLARLFAGHAAAAPALH